MITLTDYFSKWAEAAAVPRVELFSMPYNHQEDGYKFLEIKVPACTSENRSKRLWCSSFAYHAAKGDDLSKMLFNQKECENILYTLQKNELCHYNCTTFLRFGIEEKHAEN